MDYMTAETDGSANIRLIANTLDPQHRQPIAKIIVERGSLKEGDHVILRIGDMRYGGLGSAAYPFVTQGIIMIGVDPHGDGIFKSLEASPLLVEFIPDPPVRRYHVVAPSRVSPGEEFSISISALDINGNLIVNHRGSILLTSDRPVEGLPSRASFTEEDSGTIRIDGLRVNAPGIYRITIRDESGFSNGT